MSPLPSGPGRRTRLPISPGWPASSICVASRTGTRSTRTRCSATRALASLRSIVPPSSLFCATTFHVRPYPGLFSQRLILVAEYPWRAWRFHKAPKEHEWADAASLLLHLETALGLHSTGEWSKVAFSRLPAGKSIVNHYGGLQAFVRAFPERSLGWSERAKPGDPTSASFGAFLSPSTGFLPPTRLQTSMLS